MNIDLTIFKEYDIRGVYPTSINENVAYLVGKAYGSYIQEKLGKKEKPEVVLDYSNNEFGEININIWR